MIGQTISHYTILEKLGEGGMGVVYKARDTKLDRTVAVKFLPQHLTAHEPERSRFLQEAKAASALNHQNICTIYYLEEVDQKQFIVMEYVEGKTLREIVPVKKMQDAITYAIQIAEALHEAHTHGIVHRDIKAENIMVNSKNQIKVMDFGLAKLKGSLKLTKTSSTIGTLAYMAPEQIQGEPIDARSDIFSFGVVLYEMLAGKLPFRGGHEAAMMYSIVNEEPEALLPHRSDAPPELVHIITRALEKNPEDRYQGVSEIVGELRHLQKKSSRVSRTLIEQTPAMTTGVDASPPLLAPAAERKFFSPKRMGAIAGSVVAFVLVAVVLYKLLQPSTQEPRAQASFQDMKFSRLTSNGKVGEAVISPDGKYLVYTVSDSGKQSLWVRQLATGSNIQVVPPAEIGYWGLAFSPDGNFLYYNRRDEEEKTTNAYQIPVLGGRSKRVIENVDTRISISADGKRAVFSRWIVGIAESRIVVTNLDGSGENILVKRKAPETVIAPAWSPDGKSIACGVGRWGKVTLNTVPPEGGTEKQISPKTWSGEIGDLTWLSDGGGLVFSTDGQIWQVSYPGGEARKVTNDLNSYHGVSITADRKMLVGVQTEEFCNIWTMPGLDASRARQITFGKDDGITGVFWTPDGRIVYGSNAGGSQDLWIMDGDGRNTRQLTSDSALNLTPHVSPDGRYLLFTLVEGEGVTIWRMDIDGSNLKRLSKGNLEADPFVSPDGKWVFYNSLSNGNYALMKMPIEGGEPVRLSDKHAHGPWLSPDGNFIACQYQEEETGKGHKIAVFSSEGGFPLEIIDKDVEMYEWMPDGKALCYKKDTLGVSNVFSLPLDGSPSEQLTNFTTDVIFGFNWSRDGKKLVLVRGTVKNDAIMITNF